MQIYKILRRPEWDALQSLGVTSGAPVDIADGFVHFSTGEQVRETAAKHFSGEDDLILLAFNSETFGAELRWETSRGGALFPHLYAPLVFSQIKWSKPLPLSDGEHSFPAEIDQ